MRERIQMIIARYDEISAKLSDPKTAADNKLYAELMKEYKNLTPIVDMYNKYQKAEKACLDSKALLDDNSLDKELRELAEVDYIENKALMEKCD